MGEHLGTRIRAALQRAGLSQADLARRLDVEQGTVSGWVVGRREPDAGTIARIAEICSATTDELLGRPRPPASAPSASEPDDLSRTLADVRRGDWEALARTLAEAMVVRDQTELVRARALLVSQENIQAAITEARANRAAATQKGAGVMPTPEGLQAINKGPVTIRPARVPQE